MSSGDLPTFHHALVIHGTGMLRPVSLALAGRGRLVTVVARTSSRLEALADDARVRGGVISPLAVDTDEGKRFVQASAGRMEESGRFDLVVSWGLAAPTVKRLGQAIGERGEWELFHIRGSVAANPSDPLAGEQASLAALPGVTYHRIVLGWEGPAAQPRWLTNDEIAQGVLAAIAGRRYDCVIGRVRPWSERPSW